MKKHYLPGMIIQNRLLCYKKEDFPLIDVSKIKSMVLLTKARCVFLFFNFAYQLCRDKATSG